MGAGAIDLDLLLQMSREAARAEYKDLLNDLDEQYRDMFLEITDGIQQEYLLLTFGPEEEREEHKQNLASYRNALHAVRNIAAVAAYRRTINIASRVIVALVKATAKAAVGI